MINEGFFLYKYCGEYARENEESRIKKEKIKIKNLKF